MFSTTQRKWQKEGKRGVREEKSFWSSLKSHLRFLKKKQKCLCKVFIILGTLSRTIAFDLNEKYLVEKKIYLTPHFKTGRHFFILTHTSFGVYLIHVYLSDIFYNSARDFHDSLVFFFIRLSYPDVLKLRIFFVFIKQKGCVLKVFNVRLVITFPNLWSNDRDAAFAKLSLVLYGQCLWGPNESNIRKNPFTPYPRS